MLRPMTPAAPPAPNLETAPACPADAPALRFILPRRYDSLTCRALEARIGDALTWGIRRVILDARDCTFIDGRGLGSLVRLRNATRLRGGALELVGVAHEDVDFLLRLTGVAAFLGVAIAEPADAATPPALEVRS